MSVASPTATRAERAGCILPLAAFSSAAMAVFQGGRLRQTPLVRDGSDGRPVADRIEGAGGRGPLADRRLPRGIGQPRSSRGKGCRHHGPEGLPWTHSPDRDPYDPARPGAVPRIPARMRARGRRAVRYSVFFPCRNAMRGLLIRLTNAEKCVYVCVPSARATRAEIHPAHPPSSMISTRIRRLVRAAALLLGLGACVDGDPTGLTTPAGGARLDDLHAADAPHDGQAGRAVVAAARGHRHGVSRAGGANAGGSGRRRRVHRRILLIENSSGGKSISYKDNMDLMT